MPQLVLQKLFNLSGATCSIIAQARNVSPGRELPPTSTPKHTDIKCLFQDKQFDDKTAWNLLQNSKYKQPYDTAICYVDYSITDIDKNTDIVSFQGKEYEILSIERSPTWKGTFVYHKLILIAKS